MRQVSPHSVNLLFSEYDEVTIYFSVGTVLIIAVNALTHVKACYLGIGAFAY